MQLGCKIAKMFLQPMLSVVQVVMADKFSDLQDFPSFKLCCEFFLGVESFL